MTIIFADPEAFYQKAIVASETYTEPFNIQGKKDVSAVIKWDNGDGSQNFTITPFVTNDNPKEDAIVDYGAVELTDESGNSNFPIVAASGNSGTKYIPMNGLTGKWVRFRISRSAGQLDIRIKPYAEGENV